MSTSGITFRQVAELFEECQTGYDLLAVLEDLVTE